MKWDDTRLSENVEDRRGEQPASGGGGLGQMLGGGGRLGIGALIIAGLLSYFTGINFNTILGFEQMFTGGGSSISTTSTPQPGTRTGVPADRMGIFASSMMRELEDVWGKILPEQKNIRYIPPKLALFSGSTDSGCGKAESAMGPFYCPDDQKVYLDMEFFQEMRTRFGGGGDFAYAYVIAHEVGHHIENQLGILPKIQKMQEQAGSQAQSNALSVRVELLADCFAGVWAFNANAQFKILEAGDVEKAIATAQAIGDDHLQQQARGRVSPENFTHGSAADRQKWLMTGLQSGQIDACLPLVR